MLRRVALVRTDVSEEVSPSFIRVTRISELGTTLAVTSNRCTLRRNTQRNIPEDAILHSDRRENLKSQMLTPFKDKVADFVRTVRNTELHCSFRTSQETHCMSATESIRLMVFAETVAVYCENHTELRYTVKAVRTSQETSHLLYIDQPVNAVWKISRCLL
jgi:hypothetical protein